MAHTGLACQAEVTRELFNDTVLMPKRNLATLKYLVHFLEDVAANSEVNKYVCARVAWAAHTHTHTHHTSHITHHTSGSMPCQALGLSALPPMDGGLVTHF